MTRRRDVPAPPGFAGCSTCRQVKPVAEFHPRKTGCGVCSQCKVCKAARRVQERAAFAWTFTPADIARFKSKTRRADNGCLEFVAKSKDKDGYGFFYLNGRQLGAHRIAWAMGGGEVPEWPMVIDHRCKNVACVDVEHLRVVRQAENCVELAVDNPWKRNKAKSHCKNGHEFTPENTHRTPKGFRNCKACMRAGVLRHRAKLQRESIGP